MLKKSRNKGSSYELSYLDGYVYVCELLSMPVDGYLIHLGFAVVAVDLTSFVVQTCRMEYLMREHADHDLEVEQFVLKYAVQ